MSVRRRQLRVPVWSALLRGVVAPSLLVMFGCAGNPTTFRAPADGIQAGDTLAVLPLVNLSQQQNAPDVVQNAVVVQLLEIGKFSVVDPGRVQDLVVRKRLRLADRLPLATLQEVGTELGCRFVLVGSVNAFGMVMEGPVSYPSVSVTMRMVRCDDGTIVWAGSHARRGDDTESVFGLGRVATLEQLTDKTVAELLESLREVKGQGAAK
jgi:TolB-like protein